MTMCQAKHCAVLMTILFWAETSGFSTTVSVPEAPASSSPESRTQRRSSFRSSRSSRILSARSSARSTSPWSTKLRSMQMLKIGTSRRGQTRHV